MDNNKQPNNEGMQQFTEETERPLKSGMNTLMILKYDGLKMKI